MRDLVVREAIRTMAEEAAERFRHLVASGEEIPYDVREPGDGSPLPQYVPLTERFVREHAAQLRALDSFGAACAALESADLSTPYLEQLGVAAPPEPRRRAEVAVVVFLCRMWHESTDFSLPEGRLAAAIEEMEAGGEAADDEIEVIVPLRGLQMPVAKLEFATATIVCADTVDVPADARVPEGTGVAGWEPAFLAVARVSGIDTADGSAPDAGARAVEAFRQVITALRLYRPGGAGLGPHAWARSGNDRWRRIATGAGRPRAGGYRLTAEEIPELVALSRTLASRWTPFGRPAGDRHGLAGALPRAISRFEAGLERHAVLEALNDYLLAVRFLLEGGGPADLGLAMRIAALCAEPARRDETKTVIDRALALERELWTGEPAPSGNGAASPAATALLVEELVRAILRDAACGHLGSDLRATADEILLADGLAVGEGAPEQRGATAEWSPAETDEPGSGADGADDLEEAADAELLAEPAWDDDHDVEWGEADEAPIEAETATLKVPEPAGRISIERNLELAEEETLFSQDHADAPDPRHIDPPRPAGADDAQQARRETSGSSRAEQLLAARPAERQRIADRVAQLFPAPETTEWNIREIAYDRHRRAHLRAS